MSELSTFEVKDEALGTSPDNDETLQKGKLDEAIDDPDVDNCTEVTETALGTSSRVQAEKHYENSLSPKLKSIITPILDAGHRLWNAAKNFAQAEETASEPESRRFIFPDMPSLSYEYIQNEIKKLDLNSSDCDTDIETLCGDDEAQKCLSGDESCSSDAEDKDKVSSRTKIPKKPPRRRISPNELREACRQKERRLSSPHSSPRKRGHSKEPRKEETTTTPGPGLSSSPKRLHSSGRRGPTFDQIRNSRSPRLKATPYLTDIPKIEQQLLSYLEMSLQDLLDEIISNPEANIPLLVECIMDLPFDYSPERNLILAAYHEISQALLHRTEEDFVCLVFWETVNQLSYGNQVAKRLCSLLNQDLKKMEAEDEEAEKTEKDESNEASTSF